MENIEEQKGETAQDAVSNFTFEDNIASRPKRLSKAPNKKRQRKSKKQIAILENYYKESDSWSTEFIKEISENSGLKIQQVSKWLWDRNLKRKIEEGAGTRRNQKRFKTKEFEEFDEFGGYSVINKAKKEKKVVKDSLVEQLDLKINVNNLVVNNKVAKPKDSESNGTISFLDELATAPNKIDPQYNSSQSINGIQDDKNNSEKLENGSIHSGDHSNKSLGYRERFKSTHKNKGLKIKAPSISDLIKKPNPVRQDNTNNFISNLSVYSKDLASLQSNTPKSNSIPSTTPGNIYQK